MILGAAYMFYTTARYTILRAYKPVILQVQRKIAAGRTVGDFFARDD